MKDGTRSCASYRRSSRHTGLVSPCSYPCGVRCVPPPPCTNSNRAGTRRSSTVRLKLEAHQGQGASVVGRGVEVRGACASSLATAFLSLYPSVCLRGGAWGASRT